ncbi:MAG: sugar phosphate nucleotidyltransferase [Candidatus Doudnabacteria bacterium]|nr:sugar phosphate nucleotidyltransferase [Candidatus Doudnabacteria bacterium]
MKVVILCGGEGTRMKEETEFKPKPLVLVGGKPILWHIMKMYAHYGYNEFILTLGYKGEMIKDYFLNQNRYLNDFTLDTKSGKVDYHNNECDDFQITFVETGLKSLTGERVRRAKKFIEGEDFMVTYGDGLANIDIAKLAEFHKSQGTLGTISGVHPITRFGVLSINEDNKKVEKFRQYGVIDEDMSPKQIHEARKSYMNDFINGGFMVFKNSVLNYVHENSMIEEAFPLLAKEGKLSVYEHTGLWKAMDTYKDVEEMNILWQKDPFWKVW